MRTLKFVIHRKKAILAKKDSAGTYSTTPPAWYFWATIVASNGKILFTSEMYKTKRAARHACLCINDVIFNQSFPEIIDTTIKKK